MVSYSLMINGCAEGYFQGKRGLRQGDPISPMLFVIFMEYLSRLLSIVPPDFKFHHACSELKLNYLYFADDLFIFCAGDVNSIAWIKGTLEHFHSVSGLPVNELKSHIYVSAGNDTVKREIFEASGF
ncbi:uncharacterized mitochondrial protein AtMg01250-like [Rutidosis leptorrhynchoides]|uniref:uncharacterized mitochondrial protein AtMg01250-like n=1 Tax=Rutidosis leptorrhynchoides TaxID=125765 RepID=UPI003A996D72